MELGCGFIVSFSSKRTECEPCELGGSDVEGREDQVFAALHQVLVRFGGESIHGGHYVGIGRLQRGAKQEREKNAFHGSTSIP